MRSVSSRRSRNKLGERRVETFRRRLAPLARVRGADDPPVPLRGRCRLRRAAEQSRSRALAGVRESRTQERLVGPEKVEPDCARGTLRRRQRRRGGRRLRRSRRARMRVPGDVLEAAHEQPPLRRLPHPRGPRPRAWPRTPRSAQGSPSGRRRRRHRSRTVPRRLPIRRDRARQVSLVSGVACTERPGEARPRLVARTSAAFAFGASPRVTASWASKSAWSSC